MHISDINLAEKMAVSVSQLISGIKAMPDETKRKMSAIIGAVVADAASLPLQWIYDDKADINFKCHIAPRMYIHLRAFRCDSISRFGV